MNWNHIQKGPWASACRGYRCSVDVNSLPLEAGCILAGIWKKAGERIHLSDPWNMHARGFSSASLSWSEWAIASLFPENAALSLRELTDSKNVSASLGCSGPMCFCPGIKQFSSTAPSPTTYIWFKLSRFGSRPLLHWLYDNIPLASPSISVQEVGLSLSLFWYFYSRNINEMAGIHWVV